MHYQQIKESIVKKAIIFDLDMCVLDTHTLTGPFFQPVLDALGNAELSLELKEQIKCRLWDTSLEDIVEMLAVPDRVAETLREAHRGIEVPDGIKTFGDEEYIRQLPVRKILVTTGYKKFQETKIKKLGLGDLFDEIIIDELDYPDQRRGKTKIFKTLLQQNDWLEKEVLVVGDNPWSELGAAKRLGIPTAQTLRPTIVKWAEADYHIYSFSELAAIISQ